MTLAEFCERIVQVCLSYGGSVTSWVRSAKHNSAVGGKPDSKHLSGFAVDVVLDDKSKADAFKAKVKSLGLHFLDEGDHIHVQSRLGS